MEKNVSETLAYIYKIISDYLKYEIRQRIENSEESSLGHYKLQNLQKW